MKRKLTTLLLLSLVTINLFAQWEKSAFPSISMGQAYAVTNNLNKIYVGTNDGVYFSPSNGTNWSKISQSESKLNNVRTIATKGNTVFVGTYDNGVFMSNDNKIWKQISKEFLNQSIRSIIIKDKYIFVSTGKGIYSSENNGTTWKEINNGLTDIDVTSLAFGTNGIYATTFKSGVFKSKDNGTSWTSINGNLQQLELMGTKIIVNDSSIFYVNQKGFYVSEDNGNNWKSLNNIEASIRTMYINSGTIYLGTSRGEICFSKDNGKTWTKNQISSGGPYGNTGSATTGIVILGNNLFACQNGGQLLWQNSLADFK